MTPKHPQTVIKLTPKHPLVFQMRRNQVSCADMTYNAQKLCIMHNNNVYCKTNIFNAQNLCIMRRKDILWLAMISFRRPTPRLTPVLQISISVNKKTLTIILHCGTFFAFSGFYGCGMIGVLLGAALVEGGISQLSSEPNYITQFQAERNSREVAMFNFDMKTSPIMSFDAGFHRLLV